MQANVLNSFGVTQVLKLTKLQFKNMKSLAVLSPESFGIFKNQPSLLMRKLHISPITKFHKLFISSESIFIQPDAFSHKFVC